MTPKSFFFWSSLLTLPFLFLPKKKQPGVVEPGPETSDDLGDFIVTEPSAPPEPFPPAAESGVNTIPAGFQEFMNLPGPAGYSRMPQKDVPAAVMPKLAPLLAGPLGTVTKLPTEGRDIVARIEPHFHDPAGTVKPHGWHKGVSLWERKGANA